MDVDGPSSSDSRVKEALYPEYLPLSALMSGVKSGAIQQGYFNASQYNYLEVSRSFYSFRAQSPSFLPIHSTLRHYFYLSVFSFFYSNYRL